MLRTPGLLQTAATQVGSQEGAACNLVRKVLAQAVATGVRHCLADLQCQAALDLHTALKEALVSLTPDIDAVAHGHLEDALMELQTCL